MILPFRSGRLVTLTIVGVAGGMLGWILLLAGLAALQSECNSLEDSPNLVNFLRVRGSVGLPTSTCDNLLQYSWWIFVFEFIALHAPLAELFSPRFKVGSIAFLAIAAVLLMDRANDYILLGQRAKDANGGLSSASHRSNVAFAGAIISTIFNMYLICLLGWDYNAVHPTDNGSAAAGASRPLRSPPKASDTTEPVHQGDARSHPLAQAHQRKEAEVGPTPPANGTALADNV